MLISMNWISDFVDLTGLDKMALIRQFSLSTAEVENEIFHKGADLSGVVAAQIVSVENHPESHKLHLLKVDAGDGQLTDVVCGAPNVQLGMKTAFAKVGAQLGDITISPRKLAGYTSYGMCCSEKEIGISDDNSGIMVLPEDVPCGTDLKALYPIDDIIFEVDNKSLTNRPDLWGHYGMAREFSTLSGRPLKALPVADLAAYNNLPAIDMKIEDPLCQRYSCLRVENINRHVSPMAMRIRLNYCGMRDINFLADLTNYLMLEMGQPMHAFDSRKVEKIRIRRFPESFPFQTLDKVERTIDPNTLMICNGDKPVAIAGIMGGLDSEIVDDTTSLTLESATFDAASVRKSSVRLAHRTDASARYEKAIDPERCDQTFDLSMQLFRELYPEMQVTGLADQYPVPLKKAEIDVALSWLERRLGKSLTPGDVKHKMELLGYQVTFDGDNMHVVVPTWRSTGDVSIKADIMEEVARMYGYENFEAAPITTSFDGAINQLDKDLERKIKEYLSFRCGMQEIFTYPWMDESYVNAILQDTAGILALSTPPSPSERLIRSSLLPNLCKAVVKNERYFDEFAIYETAQVFRDENYTTPYDPREKLPSQRKHVAGAFVCGGKDVTTLFRKAKGVLEMMPRYTHMEGFTLKQVEKPVWADNVVWLNVYLGEERIGDLALLSKKVSMECGIKNLNVMLFELDQDCLKPFRSRTNTFTHLAEYPMTDYDISLLLDGEVKWADVAQTIGGVKNELLHGASFVDEYRGKQVPEGKKSLTARLTIGSREKTLTSAEIEDVANGVINKLVKRFGAELRSK